MSSAPLLTIVVPVFNERATVKELLEIVEKVEYEKEIVVIDDGSTDGTEEVLRAYADEHDILLIRHPRNKGKGTAIRTALEHARGELLIIQDADLEYDPQEYGKLMDPILRGEGEVVYGSRRLESLLTWAQFRNPFYHGVTVLNFLVKRWYGKRLTDEASCYKLFRTNDLRRMNLKCERFEFCPEVTAKACRLNLNIIEVPISYRCRNLSEGKKIRFSDAIEAAKTLWKYRKWEPTIDQSK